MEKYIVFFVALFASIYTVVYYISVIINAILATMKGIPFTSNNFYTILYMFVVTILWTYFYYVNTL